MPSRPASIAHASGTYRSLQWTNTQRGFVIASLINLRDGEGTLASKCEQVQRLWVNQVMNNIDGFSLDQIPKLDEIIKFSQEQGQIQAQLSLVHSVEKEEKDVKKESVKNYIHFHSNDAKSNEKSYLMFPLLDASKTSNGSGITNRKMMAYATALGVTGKVGKRRQTLQTRIAEAGGAGIARPLTRDWGTWVYTSYQ